MTAGELSRQSRLNHDLRHPDDRCAASLEAMRDGPCAESVIEVIPPEKAAEMQAMLQANGTIETSYKKFITGFHSSHF